MNDGYSVSDGTDSTAPRAPKSWKVPNILLWTLLAIFVCVNSTLSAFGYELIAAPFGLAGLTCLVVLIMRYVRKRR